MQQLLGDHLGLSGDNNTFLKELFLQHLPANVSMVLASAADTTDLAKIADMADKIVEVAAPSVSAISQTSTDAKVEKLQAEVTRLADLVASLTQHRLRRDRSQSRGRRTRSPAPSDAQPLQVWSSCQEVPGALQLGKRSGRTLAVTGVTSQSPLFRKGHTLSHTIFSRHRLQSECHPPYPCRPPTLTRPSHPHGGQPHPHPHLREALTHPQLRSQVPATMDIHRRRCQEAHPRCRLSPTLWPPGRHEHTHAHAQAHTYRYRAFFPPISPPAHPFPPRTTLTPTSPCWQSSRPSPKSVPPTLRSSMTSPIVSRPQALQCQPGPGALLQTVLRLPNGSSSICSSWASSVLPPVPGPHPSTWSPRRHPATGDPVATTVPSTGTQCPTGTPCCTFTISLPHYRVPLYSLSWTWSVPTTRSQWAPLTFPRRPLPPHSDFASLSRCPSVYATLLKPSNGLWTKCSVVFRPLTPTSTTFSSQVPPRNNTLMT